MALVAGTRLGHYEVLAPLGAGGMGEVYRARDVRLGREVAVKVLPAEKLSDPARRVRFVEEARAASSLNHPGIVTIHEIESAEGVDFIVMELVPGKTLDALIPRQGMRLGEALRLAIPLADALAAAHGAGIVHRDFKPANVMVTPEGVPKILDFGLAKLTQGEEVGRDSTTMDAPAKLSDPGTVAGTPAYMSPEQASGAAVDARSDIFAFGAVLYEMVTGRRPFTGGSSAEVVAALLKDQPPPPSQLVPDVPRELERIILRCLRKEPKRRFQHVTDLRVELEEVREESDSQAPAPGVSPVRKRGRRAWLAVAVVAIVAAVAGLLWLRGRSSKPSAPAQMMQVTFDSGLTTDPALSPDGKMLAYASDRASGKNLDLWLQHLGGGEPVRLTSWESDEQEPDFSPDGARIVFRSSRNGGGIYVIPVLGGEPTLVAPKGFRPRFSPDGSWIAYWLGSEGGGPQAWRTFVVSAEGGEPRRVAADLESASHPVWSPDGSRLMVSGWQWSAGTKEVRDWWLASLAGDASQPTGFIVVLERQNVRWYGTNPALWTRDGQWLLFAGGTGDSSSLYRVHAPDAAGRISRDPERITFGTGIETRMALGAGGQLALATEVRTSHLWSVPADTNRGKVTGEMSLLTREATFDAYPQISEDGRRVVLRSEAFGQAFGRGKLFLLDLDTGSRRPLAPAWNVDYFAPLVRGGTRVLFSGVASNGEKGGYVLDLGGGAPTLLKKDAFCWCASADGRFFLDGASDTAITAIDTGTRREFRFASGEQLRSPYFSPDGRWVALHVRSTEVTRQIFVLLFREGRETPRNEWIPITDGKRLDREPKWSPDGNLLYYLADREGARGIHAQRLDPATKRPVGAPFEVMTFRGTRRNMMFANSGQSSPAVARDKLVFPLLEVQGNIWLTQMP